jgi:hypothetical protein
MLVRVAVVVVLTALAAPSLAVTPPPLMTVIPAEPAAPPIRLDLESDTGYTRPRLADEDCLSDALAARPAAAGVDARVTFMVQRDGSLSDLAIAPTLPTAAAAAVRQAFLSCRWIQGLDPAGQPVVVEVAQPVLVHGDGGRDGATAPGPPPPPVAQGTSALRLDGERGAGFRRPVLEDEACLPAALQRQPAAAGFDNKVKFAVLRDGSVGAFTFLTPVTPEVERAVAAAFGACRWRPALDPGGEPLAVWVVQPLRVAPRPPPEPVRPLFP